MKAKCHLLSSIVAIGLNVTGLAYSYPKADDVPAICRSAQATVLSQIKVGRCRLNTKANELFSKGSAIEDRDARIVAYLVSPICPHGVNSKAYFDQVSKLLTSGNPEDVSIAIQIAGLSANIEWIPVLGSRLNDQTAASPCLLKPSRIWPYSTGTGQSEYVQPTLGDLAREALYRITEVDFGFRVDFGKWYQDYPNRQSRVWFWNNRWDLTKYRVFADLAAAKMIPPLPLRADGKRLLYTRNLRTMRSEWKQAGARQPIWQQPSFMVDSSFQKLDAKIGLSILLLEHQFDAATTEALKVASIEDTTPVDSWERPAFEPTSHNMLAPEDMIGDYVKRKKTQQDLIKRLNPAPSYPSTEQWISSYVAQYSLNASHASQVSAIADQLKHYPDYFERLTVLAVRLSAHTAEPKLLAAQKLLPKSVDIAFDLFFLNPNKYWSVLADVYTSGPASSRSEILTRLNGVKWDSFKQAKRLFKRVLETSDEATDVLPSASLVLLARLMNSSANREVVPMSLIEVASRITFVDGSSLVHSKAFQIAANSKLKEALLSALSDVKTN